MVRRAEVVLRHREVADAGIEDPGRHRVLGEPDHAPVRDHAAHLRDTEPGRLLRNLDRRGLRRLDDDVVRKRVCALDERPLLVDAPGERLEVRDRRGVQPRHLDDCRAVGAVGLDRKGRDDPRVVRQLDRPSDRGLRVRRDLVRQPAKEDPVSDALPHHRLLGELVPAVTVVGKDLRRPFDQPPDQEHLLPEGIGRDLEVKLLADAMRLEEARGRLGIAGDDPRVRLEPP